MLKHAQSELYSEWNGLWEFGECVITYVSSVILMF